MYDPIYKRFQNFVNKSNHVHDDKYNYESVQYVNAKTPVDIVCPEHGTFSQTPDKHTHGHGCSACIGRHARDTKTFIKVASKKHGGKYKYLNTEYTGTYGKVLIECPEHGQFEQVAKDHLAGCGCQECDGTYKIDRSEFIKRAQAIHGDTYDYAPTVYRADHVKIDITCRHHGIFSQTPNAHLRGQGCKPCNNTGRYSYTMFERKPELKEIPSTFYIVKVTSPEETILKVGITKVSTYARFKGGYSGYDIEVLHEERLSLYNAFKLERLVLTTLPRKTPKTKFYGWTECLDVDQLPRIQDIVDKKFYLT